VYIIVTFIVCAAHYVIPEFVQSNHLRFWCKFYEFFSSYQNHVFRTKYLFHLQYLYRHIFRMISGPEIKWRFWLNTLQTHTRAVWKVRGLALLLQVWTLWSCDEGLFFKVPPLASNALLTMLHLLLKNILQTVDHSEISCLGAPFSWLEKPRITWGEMWTAWQMFKWGSTNPLFPRWTKNST
jgi:hypothetical protein